MYLQPKHFRSDLKSILRRPLAAVALLSLLFLAACGSSEPTPTPIPPAATSTPAPTEAAPTLAVETPASEAVTETTTATDTTAVTTTVEMTETVTTTQTTTETVLPVDFTLAAFVRGGVLYIQSGQSAADVTAVEDCSAGNCYIYHLDWSPTGDRLLYFVGSYDGTVANQIRLADSYGVTQTVAEQQADYQPAGWSPDGTAIVYRIDTDRYSDDSSGPAQRIEEVWTVNINDDGALGEAVLHGEVGFFEGCGGGGRSESANAYEREGGFAYGYLAGVTNWTPSGILIYTNNCAARGVGRFDLNSNTMLDPLPGDLRSLSLNAAGDTWVAINNEMQLVTGAPDSVDSTVISTTATPELVRFGRVTGKIYYTTLESLGYTDQVTKAAELDPSIILSPNFDTTKATLNVIDPATGAETQLFSDDAYAYARMNEDMLGNLIFARIENNSELEAAMANEEITVDNWRDYLPTVDAMYLPAGSSEPTVLVADAAEYTPAP